MAIYREARNLPLREDIYLLITAIDTVAGNLNGAASRMKLYQVDKITKSIRKLTEINLEACQNIDIAVRELRNFKKVKNVKQYLPLSKLNCLHKSIRACS